MARRSRPRLFGGHCLLAVVAALLLSPRPLFADPPGGGAAGAAPIRADGPLTPTLEWALAERFAPTLVYHRDEKYFPTSPLFPLENGIQIDEAAVDPTSVAARLGTAEQRQKYYESLSLGDKTSMARVFYRVYASRLGSEPVVVIEYWLYYVRNEYRVRGNLFPLWVDSNHPNDLEHVHVVLHRDGAGNYAPYEVVGSAHSGTMPANQYRFPPGEAADRTQLIIELGSHASAPDVNGDGLFTPGIDASSNYKIMWGVRDRGITWARYNPNYMDPRTGSNAVVYEYGVGANESKDAQLYRLVPVSELTQALDDLGLDTGERRALFENHRNWFRRMFGGDNGTSAKLLAPPPRMPRQTGIGVERIVSTERGFLVGTQLNMEQQAGYAGARYGFSLPGKYVPDLVFEADGMVSRYLRHVAGQAMVSYPIDASTRLMFGKVLVIDARSPDRHQWDWSAAVEFPVGGMRVYFASRSWGPLTKYSKEVRLAYFF